ncbi:hypothetical protein BGX34_005465 [Mortierella sp. NVP85]|nr:hypothetical protein BGX34_005465 [Mortierella sp. NVP85]
MLLVKVEWYYPDYTRVRHDPENGTYSYLHIVPFKNREESVTFPISYKRVNSSGTLPFEGRINASRVLSEGKYRFDIILSIDKSLEHRTIPKRLVTSLSTRRGMLLSLLKDVHSVDVCFVFTSDHSYPKVGLWAHRAVLSKIKVFEELILEATKALEATKESQATKSASSERDQESADTSHQQTGKEKTPEEPSILTIQVDKFPLATMCSLLYYIYSGEVQLSIPSSQFAISKAESAIVLYDTNGKTRESIRWDPLSADSAWKLKDVSWEELGLAAEHYGLAELRTLCEKEIIEVMDETNAIDILFNVGYHIEAVKKKALSFIVEHMESLSVGNSNPFERFRDHPGCHDMLVEVILAKTAKKA